ncbi:MAG: hypothetical protein H6719_32480 [Sandaracinaceae bacterium]|nr:hypothetical protein [Sandaracinaceae bacterium]
MRWVLLAALLCGCSCDDEPELAAEGYVRCHQAAPIEGSRTHGDLRLSLDERELTIEGLPDPFRVAVAAGPASPEPPDADVAILLGEVAEAPRWSGGPLVLVLPGGTDAWDGWSSRLRSEAAAEAGVIDATGLRRIRAGRVELVPVAGAPARYALPEACGLTEGDEDAWELDAPPSGVTRVLVAWAAPEAAGLLGLPAGSTEVRAVAREARTSEVVFAWPSEDPRSVRAAAGRWVVRANGSREPPGWTLFEAGTGGWSRVADSP